MELQNWGNYQMQFSEIFTFGLNSATIVFLCDIQLAKKVDTPLNKETNSIEYAFLKVYSLIVYKTDF